MVKGACKRIMLILANLWYWVLTAHGDLKHPNNINNVANLLNYNTVTCNLHRDLEEPIISYKNSFICSCSFFLRLYKLFGTKFHNHENFFFELAGLTQLVPLQAPERRARNSKPARLPSQFSQDFRR